MRRWWPRLALLLSLGVNLGLVGAIAVGWAVDRDRDGERPPVALPGAGRELPAGIAVELPAEPGTGEGAVVADGEPAAAPSSPAEDAEIAGPPADRAAAPPDAGGVTGGSHRGEVREDASRTSDPRHVGGHRRGRGHGGRPGEPPLGRLADHLGLEGGTRERFIARQRGFLASHLENRRARAGLGAELRRELLAAEPDPARIEELLGRLAEAHEASERATVEVILDSRQLLDAEQQRGYFRFLDHLREGRHPVGPGPGSAHRLRGPR